MTTYKEQKESLRTSKKIVNQYSEQIGAAITMQKKLFKAKEKLTNFKQPLLWLERTDGSTELYHNVKEREWSVPNLPEGIEKKIILGKQYQTRLPYAGKEISIYICHEDWAFPHIWSKPTIYQGRYPEKIRTYLQEQDLKGDKEKGIPPGIPIILESANVNAENMRDRERKVLVAWERFTTGATAKNWMAYAKFVLYIGLAIAAVIAAWNFFGPNTVTTVVTNVTENISAAASGGITYVP